MTARNCVLSFLILAKMRTAPSLAHRCFFSHNDFFDNCIFHHILLKVIIPVENKKHHSHRQLGTKR